ncbi:MAG TPA: 4a-hydroxytetrahydrobiopterin dehydratase [bacterium]|nr:4a-hydroxytetrahydrobiopterin dehydratase [bacterium]
MTKRKWLIIQKKLTKEFEFKDFKEAINFVNNVGKIAEKLDHHPDISLYDYKFVMIATISHDVNKITERDHKLANTIDKLINDE